MDKIKIRKQWIAPQFIGEVIEDTEGGVGVQLWEDGWYHPMS